jgi:hypothetical protein
MGHSNNQQLSNGNLTDENLTDENLTDENLNHDLNPQETLDSANHPEKSTVSDRKREANRQNAMKSTGPRTERGKRFSRLNALKHKLYADVTKLQLSGEDRAQFEDLCFHYWADLTPIGIAEELAVQRIAVYEWKYSRLWRYENAIIGMATHDVTTRQREERELRPKIKMPSRNAGGPPMSEDDVRALLAAEVLLDKSRELESNISQAQIDLQAVPHPVVLETIHRAQRAIERGLKDAYRQLFKAREWSQKFRMLDSDIKFKVDGDVITI